jgi:hypothetical protein
VPALADAGDLPDGPGGVGHQLVDQRRLAHARLPEQHAGAPRQAREQRLHAGAALAGDHRLDPERRVERQQLVGRCQVALGQAQQRRQAAVEGGDQAPVDQPRAGHRVGQRRHDHEHLGVGHHRPLDRVGVVRGAAQQRRPLLDAHDAPQGVGPARQVADDGHPVADDHGAPAQLACPHGREQPPVVGAQPVADRGRRW